MCSKLKTTTPTTAPTDDDDNPPFNIIQLNINLLHINLIQENILYAGTKQRAATLFIKSLAKQGYVFPPQSSHKKPQINHLVYSGAYNGFGSIATAYAAKKLGLKCSVFLGSFAVGNNKPTPATEIQKSSQIKKLAALNANIFVCKTYRDARNKLYETTQHPDWTMKHGFYIVPMGLNDDAGTMIKLLSKQIKKAWHTTPTTPTTTKKMRFWLVAGTAGILFALVNVFTKSEFFVYLTGGGQYLETVIAKINEHNKDHDNIHIINKYKLKPHTTNDYKKYYESIENYDSKIFPYVKEYGKNGDYIWNVAS